MPLLSMPPSLQHPRCVLLTAGKLGERPIKLWFPECNRLPVALCATCGTAAVPTGSVYRHATLYCQPDCTLCCSSCPAALLIYFLGIAFPFYGSINSLMGAISAPTTAFLLPAVAFNVAFKSKAARDNAVSPPPKFLQVRRVVCHARPVMSAGFASF